MRKKILSHFSIKSTKKPLSVVDIMINQNGVIDKLETALKNIMSNTIHRVDIDPFYKNHVLGNIRMAIGEEKYKYYEDLYA